jgi:hypothetical protein
MAGKKAVPLPIRWRDAVTEHPDISSVEWAVAMALSMRMDNKSGECYPGFASIGRVTRLSRTSVKKAIKGLEGKGLLRVRRRRIARAYHDTNYYTAVLPRAQGVLPRSPGDIEVGRPATPDSSESQGDGQSAPSGQPEPESQAHLDKEFKCRDGCGRQVSRKGARCMDCVTASQRAGSIPKTWMDDPET